MLRDFLQPRSITSRIRRLNNIFDKRIDKLANSENFRVINDVKLSRLMLITIIKIINQMIKKYDDLNIGEYVRLIVDCKENFKSKLEKKTNIYFKGSEMIDMILGELKYLQEKPSKEELIIIRTKLINVTKEL